MWVWYVTWLHNVVKINVLFLCEINSNMWVNIVLFDLVNEMDVSIHKHLFYLLVNMTCVCERMRWVKEYLISYLSHVKNQIITLK